MSNVPLTKGTRLSFAILGISAILQGSPIVVSESPGTNLQLTLRAIRSARSTLWINAYELNSNAIAEAIVEQIKAGVKVDILEEGQPVGGYSKGSKETRSNIVAAMNRKKGNSFYMMSATSTSARRFRFDHAKYILADNAQLLLGSENYSATGNPEPGSKGNRGWEVLTHEAAINTFFHRVFRSDADTSHGDVHKYSGGFEGLNLSDAVVIPEEENSPGRRPASLPDDGDSFNASSIEIITAPDNSEKAIVALLDSARRSIDVELMSFNANWKEKKNPYFDALVRAAKRGVEIRVLLNDSTVFDHGSGGTNANEQTVKLLNQASGRLQARIADIKEMGVTYIHNKGVLVDGDRVLVSSINWTENSVVNNREAALVVTSKDVYDHYERLFQHDWSVSR